MDDAELARRRKLNGRLLAGIGVILLFILVVALIPSGDDEGDKKQATATTSTQSEARKRADDQAKQKAAANREADAKRRDDKRADNLMKLYRASGGARRWLIKSVEVEGDKATVKTDLFPKSSNKPAFIGACTVLIEVNDAIKIVSVEGADDTSHARWVTGDRVCETFGV